MHHSSESAHMRLSKMTRSAAKTERGQNVAIYRNRHFASSGMCHVWTAPSWQGESSRRKAWSVRAYVRSFSAVRMTAGHNALRGSGPGQNLAFDDALYLLCRIVGDTPGKFGNLNQFPQGAVSSGRDSGVGKGCSFE